MKLVLEHLQKHKCGYMPMPIILGGGLTRNIPAIENDNGRYLMVSKQIDSVHKVFYVPQFLIVV